MALSNTMSTQARHNTLNSAAGVPGPGGAARHGDGQNPEPEERIPRPEDSRRHKLRHTLLRGQRLGGQTPRK